MVAVVRLARGRPGWRGRAATRTSSGGCRRPTRRAFVVEHPFIAFVALGRGRAVHHRRRGAVRGHGPLRPAADPAGLVLPRLPGADAELPRPGRADPAATRPPSQPFFLLLPGWARIPMVVLATAATVIASQAVISGAFSVSRQAVQLGLLPPLRIRQTSEHEAGQVYLPGGQLGAVRRRARAHPGVPVLRAARHRVRDRGHRRAAGGHRAARSSSPGAAGTGAAGSWCWPAVAFGGIELSFLAANLTKVLSGGWLPLLIAATVFLLMTTWRKGREITVQNRTAAEGPLQDFIEKVRKHQITRVPRHRASSRTRRRTPRRWRCGRTSSTTTCCTSTSLIVSARPRACRTSSRTSSSPSTTSATTTTGSSTSPCGTGSSTRPDLPAAVEQAAAEGSRPSEVDTDDASYFLSRGVVAAHRRARDEPLAQAVVHRAGAQRRPTRPSSSACRANQTVIMGSDVDV